jgi:lysophospholipase L1-like esterase
VALSRKKKFLFAIVAMVLVVAIGSVLILAADLVLHYRAERSAGLNRWGYRGPVLGRKAPGEVRVAVLGGSTAFGYGVMWNESIPAMIEQRLNQQHTERRWTGVNLAYNTEGAHAFLQNLKDFAYLDYDIVVLYEGYNDLLGDLEPNYVAVRQQSPVFRATGYFPVLPLWLTERALMLRSGSVDQAYKDRTTGDKTVFQPNLADRASASALETAAGIARALERQFDRPMADVAGRPTADNGLGCPNPWSTYCDSQHRAIEYALQQGKKVLIVSQPQLPGDTARTRHQQQQDALAGMLERQYRESPRVARFAIGSLVDLSDTDVCFDGMHLSVDGNRIVADALIEPIVQLWSKS